MIVVYNSFTNISVLFAGWRRTAHRTENTNIWYSPKRKEVPWPASHLPSGPGVLWTQTDIPVHRNGHCRTGKQFLLVVRGVLSAQHLPTDIAIINPFQQTRSADIRQLFSHLRHLSQYGPPVPPLCHLGLHAYRIQEQRKRFQGIIVAVLGSHNHHPQPFFFSLGTSESFHGMKEWSKTCDGVFVCWRRVSWSV